MARQVALGLGSSSGWSAILYSTSDSSWSSLLQLSSPVVHIIDLENLNGKAALCESDITELYSSSITDKLLAVKVKVRPRKNMYEKASNLCFLSPCRTFRPGSLQCQGGGDQANDTTRQGEHLVAESERGSRTSGLGGVLGG
jgi:hypothetical protein